MRILAALAAGMLIYVAGAAPVSLFFFLSAISLLFSALSLPPETVSILFLLNALPYGLSLLDFQAASFACLAGCVMAMLARRWAYLVALLLLAVIFTVPQWLEWPFDMDFVASLAWYQEHVAPWWPYARWRSELSSAAMVAGTYLGIYLTCRLRAVPKEAAPIPASQPIEAS